MVIGNNHLEAHGSGDFENWALGEFVSFLTGRVVQLPNKRRAQYCDICGRSFVSVRSHLVRSECGTRGIEEAKELL